MAVGKRSHYLKLHIMYGPDEDENDHDLRGTPQWNEECEKLWQQELREKRERKTSETNSRRESEVEGDFFNVGFKYVPGDPFW